MTYEPRPETGTPLDSAITEINAIGEQYPAESADARFVHFIRDSLARIRDAHAEGWMPASTASSRLFNMYVHYQTPLQDHGSMAHIMRVVGDDFGITQGVDSDELWDMYEAALDRHS